MLSIRKHFLYFGIGIGVIFETLVRDVENALIFSVSHIELSPYIVYSVLWHA